MQKASNLWTGDLVAVAPTETPTEINSTIWMKYMIKSLTKLTSLENVELSFPG